jgi:CBS domain containing-hemolysin-like protein
MTGFLLTIFLYSLILRAERLLVAVSPHDAELLRSGADAASRRAAALLEQIRPTMSALLLARLLLKVLIVVFGTLAVLQSLRDGGILSGLASAMGWQGTWEVSLLLLPAISAGFAALFWGLKKIDFPVGVGPRAPFWLRRLSGFVLFWKALFYPFLKKKPALDAPEHTHPVTGTALPDTPATSEKRDIEMLKSIVKFGDVTVKQVMQPRSKVVAVDFRTDFHDLLAIVREAGFSRMPVYDEDLDNVTGILYVKDLIAHLHQPADFEWQPLIRTNVLLAPESKRVSELLQEFKQEKIHMAVVVDEYGGSAGIVTMEDILEEVTGDIRDEFDEESEIRYRKLDDANYLFEGQTLLNDVCRIVGLPADTFDPARGNADTLAGLALELSGDIPKTGTEIPWNGYLLTVTAADNRKIAQLKLTLT